MEMVGMTSRRGVIGRGLAVVAGAIGFGLEHADTAPAAVRPTTVLRLYGRGWHLHAQSRKSGQLPLKGDRHSAYGELLDRPEGNVIGHFTAAHLTLDSPFAAASSLEIQTFDLADGTIHGLGSAARSGIGAFIVLGGTGRFDGATGSYTARQGARELGGDGTAEFEFTLREARHAV